jgi:hypothetical protein
MILLVTILLLQMFDQIFLELKARYQSLKISTIDLVKRLRFFIVVFSRIQRYSVIRSTRMPYVSIICAIFSL